MNNTDKGQNAKLYAKGIFSILKNSLWLIVLQIIFSLFSVVMSTDAEEPSEIIRALSIVMTISALLIVFFLSKSTAYSNFQIYKNNHIRRKRGDQVPIDNTIKEYRWYYGILFAFIACLPSIIFAVIGISKNHITSQSNWGGTVAMLINLVYVLPFINYGATNSLYFVFLANFFVMAASGAGYFFQGEKLKLQYFRLQDKHNNNK